MVLVERLSCNCSQMAVVVDSLKAQLGFLHKKTYSQSWQSAQLRLLTSMPTRGLTTRMDFSQYGSWVARGSVPRPSVSRGLCGKDKASDVLVLHVLECPFYYILLVKKVTKSSADSQGGEGDGTS